MKIIILKIIGRVIATGSLGLVVSVSQAAPLIPFSNGNVADANDVNTNFTELETRINTISLTPGPTGSQGPAGTNGLDGAPGAGGLDGSTGPQGPQGLAGVNGIDGAPGVDGIDGAPGAGGLDGSTGPQGPQGLAGVNGIDGAPGVDGIDGAPGAGGLDGTTGPQGPQGLAGVNGIDGAPGVDGIDGAPGADGLDGAIGPQGPAGSGESSADNAIISVNCVTESLQAAIETAPLHGKLVINISGDCNDDIFVRRHITIQGETGPGTDSITGDLSGFSSDPLDDYDLPAMGDALVIKNLLGAIRLQSGRKLSLNNLTVNAGFNNSAVITGAHSNIHLNNVTLVGGPSGHGLHVYKSSAYLTNTTILGVGSGAFLAEMNSTVEFENNNTITGGDTGVNVETTAFRAISNTAVKLNGSGNTFNAGLAIGIDDDTLGVEILVNSSLLETSVTGSNQINGSLGAYFGSYVLIGAVAVNNGSIGIAENSYLNLDSEGAMTLNGITEFSVDSGSKLTLEENSPITINSGGVAGVLRVENHSTVQIIGAGGVSAGHLINMDVELLSGSSIEGDSNSKIGGNLELRGFSTYQMTGQVGSSVLGTVTCFKGEAFDFTAADPGTEIPLGSCL